MCFVELSLYIKQEKEWSKPISGTGGSKIIEKAKGILMKEQGITEESAYNLIRKSSMDKRVHMQNIAEAIVLSHEVKKKL